MICDNIKNLRKANKLTQEDIAEKLNVSRQTVSKWESGETIPDIYNCQQLAKLFDVDIDTLINEKETSNLKPKGKHIFGIVKIDKDGKIIIPKRARKTMNMNIGDRLLLLGDEEQGLAIVKTSGLFSFANDIINSKEINEENSEDD